MPVYVLVASDEMVEGIFKCGHGSGSLLSFVKGKPYTGFYFEKEGRTDRQHQITHSVWWERFYKPKDEMTPGQSKNQNTVGRSSPLKN
jgi:hypothetical protein